MKYFKSAIFTVVFLSLVCALSAQTSSEEGDEIPILAWYSIPESETSIERYKELKESGISYSYTPFSNKQSLAKALDIAKEAQIKLIISCPELKTNPQKIAKEFKEHPALAGYFLTDEPAPDEFEELGKWVRQIRAIDDDHFCYINLLPDYADMQSLGVADYQEYVHRFIEEVPVKLLTFDYYPLIEDTLRESWYHNLEVISREAKKAKKPFWAFALTTAHDPYPIPNLAQLRLQVYSNLSYGASGIEYFTYWTPKGTIWNFHHAPITEDGKRTEVYDLLKVLNTEISQVFNLLQDAKMQKVFHTGKKIPLGTKPLKELPSPIKKIKTSDPGAIVSFWKKEDQHLMMIVNRDFKKRMSLEIICDSTVERIFKDGEKVSVDRYAGKIYVGAGDVVIYQWKENEGSS